jgi:hypothetical protein
MPGDHLLRQVDRIVEPAFIRQLLAIQMDEDDLPSTRSFTSRCKCRMQLVAFLDGIDSDRRLCEEVHFNLAYRFLLQSFARPVLAHPRLLYCLKLIRTTMSSSGRANRTFARRHLSGCSYRARSTFAGRSPFDLEELLDRPTVLGEPQNLWWKAGL